MGRLSVDVPKMSPEMIKAACTNFTKYDTDGNGQLDKQEFRRFMKECWKGPVNKYLFEIIDTDHSGAISLSEFVSWGQTTWEIEHNNDTKAWLKLVFESCDIGKKGGLTKKELMKFLKYNGAAPSIFAVNKTFKKYDADGSGLVDFEEILQAFVYPSSG
jgi:Ca2+-binding EF-hand superfamily protein